MRFFDPITNREDNRRQQQGKKVLILKLYLLCERILKDHSSDQPQEDSDCRLMQEGDTMLLDEVRC